MKKDIDHNIETVNWVDLYQYETLSLLLNQNNALRVYSSYLMTTKEWRSLSRDQRTFVTKMTDNVAKMEENRRSLALIEVDDQEEMIVLNKEKSKSDLKKSIDKQKAYIRYPV